MPRINTNIGINIAIGGSSSAGSSWDPSKPLGGETLDKRFTSRSGLNMIDSLGGASAPIQLPYLYKPTGNEYAYVADLGALDIINNLGVNPATPGGDTGFTICGWAKSETTNKTDYRYFLGKPGTNTTNGIYFFGAIITTGYIFFQFRTSTNWFNVISNIDFTAGGSPWYFLRADINTTTSKLRLFINEVQSGADASFTGSIAQLADAYEFYIGAANGAAGSGVQKISLSSHSDTYIFPFLLTTAQGATLMARGSVPGATFYTDCVLHADNYIIDAAGGRNLTGVNLLKSTKLKYNQYGSQQALTVGYTRYTDFPNKDIQVPYKSAGVPSTVVPAGYTLAENNPASATGHNLADSYIAIPGVDRSDVTICSYLARATNLQHYYDSANVSWIHASEFLNFNLSNYFNDDYRGLRFSKITNRILTDFYTYATNKTGSNYEKPIKYSGETNILKFDVIVGPHICAVNGTKVLKFDDVHTLSLSTDGGVTYSTTLVTTLNEVEHAFIFDSGNIYFFSGTKAYYSFDNLASYHECSVKGIDGNDYVAGTLQNFRPWGFETIEVVHDGVTLHTWGAYITDGTAMDTNVNQWEIVDGETTINSVYKFGVSLPAAVCRHIHYITYDSISDTFFMGTGDDTNPKDNVMRGSRSGGVWTWEILGSGAGTSIWETTGISLDTDYIYIAGEDNDTDKGIRRLLRTDIANIATNQERIFKAEPMSGSLNKLGNYFILTHGGSDGDNAITISTDMINFMTRKFAQLTVSADWGSYHTCLGLLNGYIVLMCTETGEDENDFTLGSTLLIKPSIIS